MKLQAGFLKRQKLTSLQLDLPRKKERTQLNKTRDERWEVTTRETQRIMKNYYKQLYTNKLWTTQKKWINFQKQAVF